MSAKVYKTQAECLAANGQWVQTTTNIGPFAVPAQTCNFISGPNDIYFESIKYIVIIGGAALAIWILSELDK